MRARALTLEPKRAAGRKKVRDTSRRAVHPYIFTPGEERCRPSAGPCSSPRKLKLNLGSPYPKGDAAPCAAELEVQLRVQERCNPLSGRRSSNCNTCRCSREMQLSAVAVDSCSSPLTRESQLPHFPADVAADFAAIVDATTTRRAFFLALARSR